MMNSIRFVRSAAILALFALTSVGNMLQAQVTTNGGSGLALTYPDLNSAIIALNGSAITSPVVITLTGNETAPAGGYVITAEGTAVNTITIQGTSSTITASAALTAGALNDGIFKIVGGDFITLTGFTMQENVANTVTAAATNNMTEWGVALLYTTATNNTQNIRIIGNTIALGVTYQNAFGIYANATHTATAVSVAATATGVTGGYNGLEVRGNTISNVNLGIVVVGPTAAADHTDGVSIGGPSLADGNTITYGLIGTFSAFVNVSGTVNGILIRNAKNVVVRNNSLTSNGTVTGGTLNGIQFPSFSNVPTGTFTQNVSNNTFNLRANAVASAVLGVNQPVGSASATSTFICDNNDFNGLGHTIAAPTGAVTGIILTSTHQTNSISGNRFNNLTVTTTGNFVFISNSITTPVGGSQVINNNQIVGTFAKTGAGGAVTIFTTGSLTASGRTIAFTNNNFSNITLTGATTMNGVNLNDGNTSTDGPLKTVTGNTFNNWSCGTNAVQGMLVGYAGNNSASVVENNVFSNITGQGNVVGVNLSNSGNVDFTNNQIFNLSSTGAGNALTVTGVSAGTGNLFARIQRNKIYGLSANNATNTTTTAVNGIVVSAGTTVNVENNLISQLSANVAPATDGIRGISITSTSALSTINVLHNTIYLNASSTGVNFGTTGIFHTFSATATTAALNMRNNIVINESAPAGTGLTVAFRRSGAGGTNLALTSNRNLLFAGTPDATRLIYTDGTTPQQTLLGYQTTVAPLGHDANSFTGEAFTYGTPGSFFISLTGSSSDFLRPVAGISSQVESGGDVISGLTVDFANVIRGGNVGYSGTGTSPDVGAFEFEGTTPAPVISLNSVTPPTTAQCTAASRTVSVNITTGSGTVTGANILYSVNGVSQTNIPMTNTSGTTWTGVIPVPTPVNATIVWAVTATNSLGLNSSLNGTTYADEPLLGTSGSALASVATVCSGSSTNLSAVLNNPAASTLYSTPGIVNPTTDEDIRTVRITQGATTLLDNSSAINSLVGTIGTATGTAGSYSNFTGASATTLAGGQTYTLFVASIDLPSYFTNFATAFIDYNRDGDFADAGESIIPTTGQTLNAAVDNGNDSIAVSFTVPTSAIDGLTRMRVVITETGQTNAAGNLNNLYGEFEDYAILISGATPGTTNNITSVSWFDGATLVGTGNPLTVNPTATTTYTASITAFGCTLSPAPTTTVTVNALPTAPTATNSAQCGNAVPSASVTSTSGLPTPTFIWYSAAVAGTALQTSTSTTYTTAISSTTTFYVAELNTVTGCESARTPVTVTVAIADNITASANNTTICIGSSVDLSVVNANPTPLQSYTYTWTNAQTGSGLTSVSGANQTVTPTQPGTYTYNVAGVDGGCNALASVIVTVNPFTATLTPINISCNGYNDGSFSIASTTCGSAPFSFIVDGGALTATIPNNLTPGAHTVIVQNASGFQTSVINITITQPTTVISAPVGTNAAVCQNASSATVSASATTSVPTTQTAIVSFALSAQPTEVNAAPGVTISTATVPALPAGAIITGLTLASNGLIPNGGEYQTDVKLGLSGIFTDVAAQGAGLTGFGTVSGVPYNYTRAIPVAGFPTSGGSLNVVYWNDFNDVIGGPDATFPLGASAITLTINYSIPTPVTVSWWTAASGGTQIGTGSPFETVGTTVLPNTNTPGTYTLYAQGDLSGCSNFTRTPVTVTVNALPVVDAGADQTVCAGTAVTLTGSPAGGTWSGPVAVTNGVSFTPPAGIHNFTYSFTNASGCTNTDAVVVTVNALPVVNAGADQTVCDGASVTLTGSPVGGTWSGPITITDGVAFTPPVGIHNFTYSFTNASGCTNTDAVVVTVNALPVVNAGADQTVCEGTAVTLTGSPVGGTWSGPVTITDGVAFTPPAGVHTFTYSFTNASGCTSTDAVDVTVNALPVVNAGPDQTVCEGTAVTLTGSTVGGTWSGPVAITDGVAFTPPAGVHTFNYSFTNGSGCTNTDTVVVTVNALPVVNAGADQTVCEGAAVTLTGSPVGGTWSGPVAVTDGVAFTPPAGIHTFVYSFTNGAGCSSSDTVLVLVNTLTAVDAGVDQTVCGGTAVTLTGSPVGGTWSGPVAVTDGVAFTPPAGVHTFVYSFTNGSGCTSTDTVVVTVNALPVVNAGADQTVCDGESVALTGSPVGGTWSGPISITDGVAFTAPVGIHTFTYSFTNGTGCTNTDTVLVTVNAVPSATATDNGDGTITASSGASYQWIDCDSGLAIVGETNQTLTVTANGSYAVVVSNGTCSDTSACAVIDYIGIKELAETAVQLMPNPTRDNVTITMSVASAMLEVRDAQGKLMVVKVITSGEQVDLSQAEVGVYFFTIKTANGSVVKRVVKN